MDYKSLFDAVRLHLDLNGVACKVVSGKAVASKAVDKIEAKMGIRLPAELREFYLTMGDGLTLSWRADPDDLNKPFANFEVPSLKDLAGTYAGWRKVVLYSPELAEKYGFPYTKDPALAKRTAARMWHWLPVLQEGNGDTICLDLSEPGCPVVFDQHDWMDGGTGDNGHLLAPNWGAFMAGWGRVCFQFNFYWPSWFPEEGGVGLDGKQFHDPFRLGGLG